MHQDKKELLLAFQKIKLRATSELGESELFLSEEWGSGVPNYRLRIRKFLQEKWGDDFFSSDVMNLEEVPLVRKSFFISISHCPGMGGVFLCSRPVGFDLEKTDRIKPEVLLRVSSQESFLQAPDHATLWCAKEASLKSMYNFDQPTRLSQIEVSWLPCEVEHFKFSTLQPTEKKTGLGWCLKSKGFSSAIAVLDTNSKGQVR